MSELEQNIIEIKEELLKIGNDIIRIKHTLQERDFKLFEERYWNK